jgi:hypothetical protein
MSGLTLQQTIYICEPDELRKPKRSLREKDCVANLLGRDLVALPPSENCAMSQLGVRVDTLYRSSSFVVNLECFLCSDSDIQVRRRQTFASPRSKIQPCTHAVPDLGYRSAKIQGIRPIQTRPYLSAIEILPTELIYFLALDLPLSTGTCSRKLFHIVFFACVLRSSNFIAKLILL